jgi:hypothetical protein
LIINLTNEIYVLKKGKSIDGSYSLETMKISSSATPAPLQEPIYGMPPSYFAGQTLPPQPVRPVQQTGVMVVSPPTPAPLTSIPCLAGPTRMNELANFTPSYTTVAYSVPPILPQGSSVPCGLIPDNIYDEPFEACACELSTDDRTC